MSSMTRNLKNQLVQPVECGRKLIVPPHRRAGKNPALVSPGPSPFARAIVPLKNMLRPYDTLQKLFYPQDLMVRSILKSLSQGQTLDAYLILFNSLRSPERMISWRRTGEDVFASHTMLEKEQGRVIVRKPLETLNPASDALATSAALSESAFFLHRGVIYRLDPRNPEKVESRKMEVPSKEDRIVLPLGREQGFIDLTGPNLKLKGIYVPSSTTVLSISDAAKLFALEFAADMEPSSGLYKASAFERSFSHCIDLFNHEGMDSSLLRVDIGFMGRIKDTYGPAAANRISAAAGALGAMVLHPSDLITSARPYGGEFLALLPGATLAEAIISAQKWKRAIENHSIELPNGKTVSVYARISAANVADAQRITQQNLPIRAAVQALLDRAVERAKSLSERNIVVAPVVDQNPARPMVKFQNYK